MGLSRLDNFLKSARGTILYVDPNSLDSTDSIENSGNSLTRPFKTIQRALIEAARFSYQRGPDNDRFNKTTILLYPGDHIVDNRPGYIPTGSGTFSSRDGSTGLSDLVQWDLDTRFDLTVSDNTLYKLNSIYGGVIIPRGTSIVGMDLRKTRIRPTFIPNPENDNIDRSCVFRVTGSCYLWQFTLLDADPNGICYKDYTTNTFVPNFSHHKLAGFEYADGVNGVEINDDFLNGGNAISTTRTDLDMYYEKVARVYGPSSGREIVPDYGDGVIDIQPVIDEYRIVGTKGRSVGISSIRSGNGSTATTTITVDLAEAIEDLSVDSPIQISGVSAAGYDGQYVIYSVPSTTQITYQVQSPPKNALPGISGATLNLTIDTVTSSSPYIFNISLRSVYGMCGLLADGVKSTGFKSMVVAQYTGIGLQKDDNAFVKYDSFAGDYEDSTTVSNLHTDSNSRFKPEYENFHIKATNDAFLQLVSVFAIGYAQHFVAESGGDIAINNSNSNFGAKSLVSYGFKRNAFGQDDYGYITHILPPKEIESDAVSIEFNSLDVGLTTSKSVGAATTSSLYIYNETDQNIPPRVIIDGYHIGAKENELLTVEVFQNGFTTSYSSRVVMPTGTYNSTQSSSEKVFTVGRSSAGINTIVSNTLTLTQPHSFINGESIRILADNGHLPDGLNSNQTYYVITKDSATGIGSDQIRIAQTLSDALNGSSSGSAIQINNKGGTLSIISRVSDKNAGDIGHPVQWDTSGNWYINVATATNGIYDAMNSLGVAGLGNATTRTYVTRKPDSRGLIDTLYRVRYVLPKDSPITSRPPIDGYILQESNNIIGTGSDEISQLYNTSGSISNSTILRNPKFIADASWSSNVVTITSELPHELSVGDQVEIDNILPALYNGTYSVTSIIDRKKFTYTLTSSPGTFASNTSARDEDLPYFRRKRYTKTYQVYRTQEIQSYIPNSQDGIYYLTLINHSNYPTVTPFRELGFAQPVENLYPQSNNDNPKSDPDSSVSHALPDPIGKVVIDDPQNSITKETLESFIVGFGITNIQSTSGTSHTIFTTIDHGFSGITSVSIVSGGTAYGNGSSGSLYNAQLVGFAGSTTGSNATAKITVNGSGSITNVKIIDSGSAYGIGNTLRVVGVATTSGFVEGVVTVSAITNNIGDTIQISGISSASNSDYNTLYRISGISTGKPKEITAVSANTVSAFSASGLGLTVTSNAEYIPTGKAIGISTFLYDSVTGLATVGFTTSHGFLVNNKIRIGGANELTFNKDFIVKNINSLTSVVANIGVAVTNTPTGDLYAYRPIFTSYGGDLTKDTESTSGRLNYEYAGVTAILKTSYFTEYSDQLTNLEIANAVSLGLNLGDYLLINNEVFRIRTAVTSDSVSIFRSILGSPRQSHISGSVVRKIKVYPVELRRNSIIRASGHTFEYLGFGPGNYSTSLPEKQNRILSSSEKFLAQATKSDGGIVVYTGMNSDGDFFAGNKKINSATGKEESFDTPVPTITGEKESNSIVNITDTQKLFVESSLKVEGGKDKNSISEFDGPVIFNNKVTSNSDIEANSILLQGEEKVSRKISISNEEPTISSTYGDIIFNSEPSKYDFIGWTYVTENKWEPFGFVGGQGVGISSGGDYVGFATLVDLVAIGFTFNVDYDNNTGISTLTFDADPRVAISTGALNTILGRVQQLNFVGAGITLTGDSTSGIATINIPVVAVGGTIAGTPYNSLQWNDNDKFSGVPITIYDDINNLLVFGDYSSYVNTDISKSIVFNNAGSVGFACTLPTAKIEIVADNETSIYIRSTSGSDIIKVENTSDDTTPFIIDANGNVGINTGATIAPLDVFGNAAVTGQIRIYKSDRTNYIGLGVSSLASDLNFTLPNSYGSSGQVLSTSGSGVLIWKQTSNQEVVAGAGITITYVTVGTGLTVATISNSGVKSLSAGSGISITGTEGNYTITATRDASPYPYTTTGFGMII